MFYKLHNLVKISPPTLPKYDPRTNSCYRLPYLTKELPVKKRSPFDEKRPNVPNNWSNRLKTFHRKLSIKEKKRGITLNSLKRAKKAATKPL